LAVTPVPAARESVEGQARQPVGRPEKEDLVDTKTTMALVAEAKGRIQNLTLDELASQLRRSTR
jgi:hypothetical protein